MTSKPALNKSLSKEAFRKFYWLKSELIDFCSQYRLPSGGSKEELTERISTYLETGKIVKAKLTASAGKRDSANPINRDTLVVNYKNDAKTRDFFVSQIGAHFHFTSYLRQFTNTNNITPNLTYGDLVDGWLAEEAKNRESPHNKKIGEQFEYNQFIRDFFANETGKSLSDAIRAWKLVTSIDGENTYKPLQKLKAMLKG
jgi:hypothetical protein